MKGKIILISLFISLIAILIPNAILAFENVAEFDFFNVKYELFDNGTAKAILAEDRQGQFIDFANWVEYNGKEYTVTSIGKDVFSSLVQNADLYLSYEEALKLDLNVSFDKINNIYIKQGATGYTEEAGWPIGKVKTYKIIQQPQDIDVEAGNIKDTDILTTVAEYPVAGGSLVYNWYECDKDGNLISDIPSSSDYEFKIPKDLTYDNKNNTSKDYYFKCVVGSEGDVLATTRVAKVTVNLGVYKVIFEAGDFASWISESINGYIELPVNNERKLDATKIPTSEQLKVDGKGLMFVGWRTSEGTIIDPEKTTFDKNTTLYPVWEYKIIFDANGGKFSDGNDVLVKITNNDDDRIYEYIFEGIEEPKREGYKFLGFYDAKTEGNSIEDYLYKNDGFYEEVTFYAKWKKIAEEENENKLDNSIVDNNIKVEQDNDKGNVNINNNANNDIKVPQTGDSIIIYLTISIISILSLGIMFYIKRK